jgi:LysM repeat protein
VIFNDYQHEMREVCNMKVHSGRWFIVTLIVLFTIVMAACTRPARPGDETPTSTVATSSDGTVSGVVTATVAADTTSGGDTTGGDAAADSTATTVPPQPVEVTPEATSDASTGDTSGGDTGATTPDASVATPDAGVATPDTSETTTEDAPTPEPAITATPVVTTTADTTTGDTTTEDTTTGDAAATTGTPPTTEVNHTVQLGESLYRIGLQYGYSWTVLAQYNGITNPNYLTPGQVIKIPAAGTPPPTTPPGEQLYTVKRGDTLGMIAAAYGVSWVQIAEANGVVNPNLIYPGQVLKIPSNTPGPAPQFSHVVKQGETLFLISLHYGVVWTQIAEANSITAPYVIFPGQTLIIPGGS